MKSYRLSQNQIDSIVKIVLYNTIKQTEVKSLESTFTFDEKSNSHIVSIKLVDIDKTVSDFENITYFELHIQDNYDMILQQILSNGVYTIPITNNMVLYTYIRNFVVSM